MLELDDLIDELSMGGRARPIYHFSVEGEEVLNVFTKSSLALYGG